ncbi:MAG: HepT-like ribonuclease domain-containing protein [Janthinobacterium lividum]
MSKPLDSTRLQHLGYAAERVLNRLGDTTLQEFLADEDLQDILLRQFTVIGEAAAHISDSVKQRFPHLNWRQVVGFRNFVVHEYFRIDFTLVYDTATGVLPRLVADLPAVLQQILADEATKQQSSV